MLLASASEDSQLMSKDLEVNVAGVDVDCPRHHQDTSRAGDATDEGGTLQEQAHITLLEESRVEEVCVDSVSLHRFWFRSCHGIMLLSVSHHKVDDLVHSWNFYRSVCTYRDGITYFVGRSLHFVV